MGLRSVAPTPNTGKPAKTHKAYPYLLRNTEVPQPSQVWATDITYLCLRGGFVYLVAIMDWYSRKFLSWKLSSNMESSLCVSALERALRLYPATEIFNSDQGGRFTSQGFTDVLIVHDIQISMDGKHHLRIAPVAVGKIRGTHLKEYESAEELRKSLALRPTCYTCTVITGQASAAFYSPLLWRSRACLGVSRNQRWKARLNFE